MKLSNNHKFSKSNFIFQIHTSRDLVAQLVNYIPSYLTD